MMRSKLLLALMIAMISTLWLFAGYAAAQHPGVSESVLMKRRTLERSFDFRTASGSHITIADIVKTTMSNGYIPVFIDPLTGDIFVYGSSTFTNGSPDLEKFINAENAGNSAPVGQFYRYQYNPNCIWYVDSQGILRKRCL